MADLNVSLIVRYVDRLSAPARAATKTLGLFTAAQRQVGSDAKETGAAVDGATASVSGFGRIAEMANRSTANLASTQNLLTRGSEDAGRSVELATNRIGRFERMQWRARSATRMLGGEMDRLSTKMSRLAMATIVTDGMERTGRGIFGPIKNSVERSAEFQKGMTGIGILADLSNRQLGRVQANIMASAQRLAIPIGMMQQDDMAVLNEGVYRKGPDLMMASNSAARLSLLAEIGGAPITGAEAGGLMATYAHSMLAPARMADRLNATLFRASQIGGNKVGDAARFLPEIMGQMKARAFGNYQGFVDANAALQITKRVTGNDEAAGTDVRDLMQNLNHMLTDRRFAKAGMDLEKIIAVGVKNNISPLTASLTAIMAKVGSSATDPGLAGKLGKFFQNAQAATAATAIITNQRDTDAGPGFNSFRRQIADPSALTSYYAALQRASNGPYADLTRMANAQQAIAISTGKILFPALNKIATVMTRLADLVTRFENHGGLMAKAAVYAASGVGVLALSAGALGNAVVGVIGPLWLAKSLFGRVIPLAARIAGGQLAILATRFASVGVALRGVALAALADPMVWPIVAGVVAVAGAALLIRKYWQPISTFFGGMWSGIAEGLRPLAPVITRTARGFAAAFRPLTPIWTAISGGIGAVWRWITKLIEPVRLTGAQLKSTANAGRQFGLALVGIGRTVANVLNPAGFVRVGAQLMAGLVRGVFSMAPAVQKAITRMGDNVARWFKARLGIRSPSTVFARLGDHTLAGYAMGLDRSARLPLSSLARLSAAMTVAAASMALPNAPAMAAINAAAVASTPPPHMLAHIAQPAPTKALADPRRDDRRHERGAVHVTNTFHIHQGTDANALANRITRLQESALRRAAFDEND